MSTDAVLAQLLVVLAGVAGPTRTPGDLGPDTPIADGGLWLGSVDVLELVLACEEAFGIVFDPETDLTPATLSTPATLAAVIREKIAG